MARKTTLASVWSNLEIEREITHKEQRVEHYDESTIKTWHSVSDGHERVYVSVFCDWTALQGLLHSAARNKSGKSTDGAFTAIVERREKID